MPDNAPRPVNVFTGFQNGQTIFVLLPEELREYLGWPADRPTSVFLSGLDGPPEDRRIVIGITPPRVASQETTVQ